MSSEHDPTPGNGEGPKVSIIVVSYNTRDLTVECLRSVVEHVHGVSYELIVVDNHSDDGSAQAVADAVPQARLIALDENIGFAAANNLAAKDASGEYLLLLNPDTLLLDDAVSAVIGFADANPRGGVWGGRTLFGDRSLNPSSCWRRITFWGLVCGAVGLGSIFRRSAIFNPEGYGGWKRDCPRQVDIVTGCFLLIRRTLWRDLNGFDPAFFMYGEDADLCLRARGLGYRPMITPQATLVHYGGRSERSKPDKIIRLLRAKQLLIRRHWPRFASPAGVALLKASILSRRLAHAVITPRPGVCEDEGLGKWARVWQRRREWAS